MVLGQELDITADPIHADEEFIKKMHYLKTGKLIIVAMRTNIVLNVVSMITYFLSIIIFILFSDM